MEQLKIIICTVHAVLLKDLKGLLSIEHVALIEETEIIWCLQNFDEELG